MGLKSAVAFTVLLAGLGASVALAQQAPAEIAANQAAVKGAWKNPAGGTCDAAYLKASETTKTVRGEAALATVVTNAGLVVNGQFILSGAREGQIVNPMNDKAIFLIEPQDGNKLHVIPIGEPALSWPEVVLDLCPGSR
jgi:hypothetical protein